MKIEKIKIGKEEFTFLENISLGILKIKRCIDKDGKYIFLRISNFSYKKISNKIILKILEKK